MANICIYCRSVIVKSGNFAYLCINCEALARRAESEEKQVYLDSYI